MVDPGVGMAFEVRKHVPTAAQRAYLRRGLDQPDGKLPLFDAYGQQIDPRTIKACIDQGWAQPWFANPLKPEWLVCRLTPAGRTAAMAELPAVATARPVPQKAKTSTEA